jgi:hypothetical protein
MTPLNRAAALAEQWRLDSIVYKARHDNGVDTDECDAREALLLSVKLRAMSTALRAVLADSSCETAAARVAKLEGAIEYVVNSREFSLLLPDYVVSQLRAALEESR